MQDHHDIFALATTMEKNVKLTLQFQTYMPAMQWPAFQNQLQQLIHKQIKLQQQKSIMFCFKNCNVIKEVW